MSVRRILIGLACAVPALGTVSALVAGNSAAIATAETPMPRLPPLDRLVVNKAQRTMELWSGGALAHTITGIQLGDAPVGPKRFQGDERTPEGHYTIGYGNPRSAYHLSLYIDYPRPEDVAFARAQGRSPGGQIFIHGQPNHWSAGRVPGDWTDGCIALSNEQIEALWQAVPNGTPIEIRP